MKGQLLIMGIVKKSFIDIIFRPSKGECLLLMFVILGGCWQAYCNLLYLYYVILFVQSMYDDFILFVLITYQLKGQFNKGLYLNHLLTLQHLLCVHQHLM